MEEIDLDKLLTKLDQSSFTSFEIHDGDFNLKVKKEAAPASQPVMQNNPPVAETTPSVPESEPLAEIKAPFVGVVYFAPAEGENPYIQEGSTVKKGDTVALIEAMKMFNEVHSPIEGEVVEILVDNGSMVEYDQPIARIREK